MGGEDRYFREMLILRKLREKNDFSIKKPFSELITKYFAFVRNFDIKEYGFFKNTTRQI